MRRRLTKKQQKLIEAYKEDPEASLSSLGEKAGYSHRQNVYLALKSPHVISAMSELIERRPKLSDEKFLDHLEEGLEARNGMVPDWSNRHKYWREWGKMKGHIKEEAPKVTNNFLALFDQAYEQFTKQTQIPH